MYIWSSSNTSVATVSTKGIVITTNAVGHTQARAADMKNLAIFGTAEVGSQSVLNTPSSCRVIGVQLPQGIIFIPYLYLSQYSVSQEGHLRSKRAMMYHSKMKIDRRFVFRSG